VEATFEFGRHTGVTLEPRSQVADWNAAEQRLTVYHSFQAPHMMQDLYSRQFDIPESAVRVICRTSAARSASRCMRTPTISPPWRCRCCAGGR
jgi:CO/xanthine dehydrogenase Mo-binding subunit